MMRQLRIANQVRQQRWEAGNDFSVLYFSNALAGEAGELCNVIKKLERAKITSIGSKATIADAAEELADVVIYADLLAAKLGIDLKTAVISKFNATSEKYGLGVYMDGG